jgi:hypothetical protein
MRQNKPGHTAMVSGSARGSGVPKHGHGQKSMMMEPSLLADAMAKVPFDIAEYNGRSISAKFSPVSRIHCPVGTNASWTALESNLRS